MNRDAIAGAHRRTVEQVTSDERLLGLLPEELAGPLVRWIEARLDAAASAAASVDAYLSRADEIRAEARRIADAADHQSDDVSAFLERLKAANSGGVSPRRSQRTAGARTTASGRRAQRGGEE